MINRAIHCLRPPSQLINPSTSTATATTTATRNLATINMENAHQHFLNTSGETDPVWIHQFPYPKHPTFSPLSQNITTDVAIVGAGIAGIQTAYELIERGKKVTMLEARHVLSGESGRTSGHLSNALDDEYTHIKEKHGSSGARAAAESHTFAINRVGEIARKLGVECEYRQLPGYKFSSIPRGQKGHDDDISGIKWEAKTAKESGVDASFKEGLKVKGWDGKIDQQDGAIFNAQATFHPTKYLSGVLAWLKEQPNFACYAETRATGIEEKSGHVEVSTDRGYTVTAGDCVEATCIPLQKLSIVAEMGYYRTYCIAIRVPRGTVEDCLIYDTEDPYKYIRFTACDEQDDYLVIGGCDHKVGQENTSGRFEELENWVRERFTSAGKVDYRWSGQIMEPVDFMAFIGKNQGMEHTYVVTGDSGNGLTHGVLAGRLIADEIEGKKNSWAGLYSPKRLASIGKSAGEMLRHDLQINTQYKRWLQSDVGDIEDIVPGSGGVVHEGLKPVAVYKDDGGNTHKMSAVCPHMKGVVCWNDTEKSWDCPVHGSRFSCEGMCVEGPAKTGLQTMHQPQAAAAH
ncbi:FAD-dependent oxidoreductase [Aspergillus undulatus]|uniref:FAD-dependent oxidoreductase n=1 Tax=Aspergillus undulatus TaxID=1810928 RepID=UPI003CCCB0B7